MSEGGHNYVAPPAGYVQNELGQWVPDVPADTVQVDAETPTEPQGTDTAAEGAEAGSGEPDAAPVAQ